jgi:anti-anti-sigma factor
MRIYANGPVGNDPVMPAIVAEVHGDTLTLRLTGDIDAFTAPALLEQAHLIIKTGSGSHVVADLAEVTFCDAAAIRALDGLAVAAADRGGSLRLRDAQPHIRWLCLQVGAGDLLAD